MKKSLIALAVLGAMAGAASAQSSVTMYGIVDVGLQWNEQGFNRGTTAAPNWSQESNWGINGGYQSGNRLGVRGAEALGRGWSAIFDIEMGFSIDTGASSTYGFPATALTFGRQAYGGFRHTSFGTFALGRMATSSSGTGDFDLFGNVDPFGTGFSLIGLQATFIPSGGLREDNSILWQSPSWGGLKLGAQYSANVFGAESAPNSVNTQAYNLGAQFVWGPLLLAATYDVINFPGATGPAAATCIGATTAGCPDQKMLQLGGVFDFKFLKLHAAWANQDNISVVGNITNLNAGGAPTGFLPVGIGNYNNNAYMVGLTVPLFGGNLLGSYQWSDAKNTICPATQPCAGAQFEPDYNVWGIGYTYPFSRRTNLYIGYGERSWDGRVTATGASGAVLPQASQAFDKSQLAIGFRHIF